MRRALLTLLFALAGTLLFAAPSQALGASPPIQQDVALPIFPADSMTVPPVGFKIDGAQALAVAKTSRTLQAIHRRERPLVYQVQVWSGSHYEVLFFFKHRPVADVIVSRDGRLGRTWTGPLIDGVFGRGHYEPLFNSPWVWLPFGLMFLLPWLRGPRRLGLRHLDLAVLLSFGVSYHLFNQTHLVTAVWLCYPPMLYLLVRMVLLGCRPDRRRMGLEPGLPDWVLALGLIALVGARIGLALGAPRVIDVGYASVIGAYRILHGMPLYYPTLGHPDTYGPIAYLAYAPFEAIWPWQGVWNYLAAARVGAISFDVLTITGLIVLGRRLRAGREGRRLGLMLAWLWAAYPLGLLGVMVGTNDGLVALLVVLVLLGLTSPIGRGALLGLAAAAKFVPAMLLPVVAVGRRGGEQRSVHTVVAAFVVVVGVSVAVFLPPGGIRELYDHTIGYQLSRSDVFSLWALHPTLSPIKDALELGAVVLAAVFALRPRGPRSVAQVSALMGAIMLAAQLPAVHWFYYYIMWFLPLVLVAVVGAEAKRSEATIKDLEPMDVPVDGAHRQVLVGAG